MRITQCRVAKILLTFSLTASFCAAKAGTLAVKVKKIESVHSQEERKDELYLTVTEFPKNEPGRYYRIPEYPAHWTSSQLDNIKNLVLWQKTTEQCQPIDLMISLVEKDLAPWDVDDLLGSVVLKVRCVNGKATEEWSIPNAQTTTQPLPNEFSFTGKRSSYRLAFVLENKQSIPHTPQKAKIKQRLTTP